MHTYFHNMPAEIRRGEETARTKIVSWISSLASESESSQSSFVVQLAGTVGEWLKSYFEYVTRLIPFWMLTKYMILLETI
jgi:hypothetical protein